MYTLVKQSGLKKFLTQELPSLGISLAIAEIGYKFGSFLLECTAFLITWYFFSWLLDKLFSNAPKDKR